MNKHPKYSRRLLRLAAFLEKLPPARFNYAHWVGEDFRGKADLSCGTTACALGWATTIPEFRKLGLELGRRGTIYEFVPRLKGSRGFHQLEQATAKLFGLSSYETGELFYPGRNGLGREASAKDVARHIRAFVKRETGQS